MGVEMIKKFCKFGVIFAVAIFGVLSAGMFYEFIASIFAYEYDQLGKAVAIFYAISIFGILKGFEKIYCACSYEDEYE